MDLVTRFRGMDCLGSSLISCILHLAKARLSFDKLLILSSICLGTRYKDVFVMSNQSFHHTTLSLDDICVVYILNLRS